jgi:hypothetical protein
MQRVTSSTPGSAVGSRRRPRALLAWLLVISIAGCRPVMPAPAPTPAAAGEPAAPRASAGRRVAPAPTPTPEAFGFSAVASGLVNPRGMTFGPDGTLYVAEAGNGGAREVELGRKRPHLVGRTGRVSSIAPGGTPTPLIQELPSIVTAAHEEVGPTGLAFVDGALYLLTASGGWDVGDPSFDSGVLRLDPAGRSEPARIFDLTVFNLGEPAPARRQDERADVPAGMPFGLTALGGVLYATDGNHEVVLRLTTDGKPRRILEYPASDRALTGITAGPDGALYVAEYVPGKVTRLATTGERADAATGFALPIGVAFDGGGRLCVLEYVGRVFCLGADGRRELVAAGLTRPTAMVAGPDDALYVANVGHFGPNGEGEVVRVGLGR